MSTTISDCVLLHVLTLFVTLQSPLGDHPTAQSHIPAHCLLCSRTCVAMFVQTGLLGALAAGAHWRRRRRRTVELPAAHGHVSTLQWRWTRCCCLCSICVCVCRTPAFIPLLTCAHDTLIGYAAAPFFQQLCAGLLRAFSNRFTKYWKYILVVWT